VREAWQQPLAQTGYAAEDEGAFPLVSLLAPKMRARVVMTGDPDSLDVFSSQLQVPPSCMRPHGWVRARVRARVRVRVRVRLRVRVGVGVRVRVRVGVRVRCGKQAGSS
jgi:hypothetical protein